MKDKIQAAILLMYKNMGFSQKAIDGVVGYLEQTVTAEDQIDASVKAVEGMLKAMQSEIDGRVSTAVAKAKSTPAADPAKPEGDPAPVNPPANPPADMPAWAKALLDQNKVLVDKVAAIEQGKSADTRKTQLETALKDAPEAYRNTILKGFARMNFDKDEDFTTYLDEVKTDSAAFIQTQANDGLGKAGKPFVPAGDLSKAPSKEEVADVTKLIM